MPESAPQHVLTQDDLRWLVCPVCHQSLKLEFGAVLCTSCGRRYPIIDGIPVLLAGRVLNPDTLPEP